MARSLLDTNLFDRTLANLRQRVREIWSRDAKGAETIDDPDRLRERMRQCLEAHGGEVSARARAAALGRGYLGLDKDGRRRFLLLLAREFDVDHDAVDAAMAAVQSAKDMATRARAESALRIALEPARIRLLTQFNALPQGIKFLVDLRAELMSFARDEPDLRGLEDDLRRLLAGWFDIGFLELRQMDWQTPAALLEKLITYEAVHEIRSWSDLKKRLGSDRRCFAFFHPRMPDEPLIFVEIALVSGIAASVQVLLDESQPVADAAEADTAIFYSISNAQRGLAGISFGDFLIKRVVDVLARELKNLKNYSTLSPIPGLRKWLDGEVAERGDDVLLDDERALLAEMLPEAGDGPLLPRALARAGWPDDPVLSGALHKPLLRLAATYLVRAKRKDGVALDPVEHFHLSNGARVERLNWLGDTSPKGLAQSAGLMVNYLYRLDSIESNHEAYRGEGKIATSSAVRGLIKG